MEPADAWSGLLRSGRRNECQDDPERPEQKQGAPEEVPWPISRSNQVRNCRDEDPGTYDNRDKQPGLEAEGVAKRSLCVIVHTPNLPVRAAGWPQIRRRVSNT